MFDYETGAFFGEFGEQLSSMVSYNGSRYPVYLHKMKSWRKFSVFSSMGLASGLASIHFEN